MSNPAPYAHVILPLPTNGYTYAIPAHLNVQVGSLVRVPLGKTRHYWGVVSALQDKQPEGVTCKEIEQVAYPFPLVTPTQLQLWSWMAGYYCCTMGDVLKAALPTLLQHDTYKPAQQTYVKLVGDTSTVKREQQVAILERFKQLTAANDMDEISVPEPNEEPCQSISVPAPNEEPCQSISVPEPVEGPDANKVEGPDANKKVLKSDLLEGQSLSAFNTLVKHGILACFEQETSRLVMPIQEQAWPVLSKAQQAALQSINQAFAEKDMVLLHGVTASGKTEIYLKKIQETLQKGQQVLYLVPEIALTSQLENRLQRVLGGKMVAYHSQISDNHRAEIYLNLLQGKEIQVVLGTRSSVFLPFQKLGLVIIDEEHEPSYKQYEPAPRYHAKNAALVMAQFTQAQTLLGSATPSIETYYLAQQGKYGYVPLTERYSQVLLPRVEVIDRQDAFKKNRMNDMFSWFLKEKMEETLRAGQQVILFQNRRGFSSFVECTACGYVPKCKHCDVSLTYHKNTDKLVCHYCGYTQPMPPVCPSCGAEGLKDKGFGTEKVVEALQKYFPDVSVDRLDVDITRSKTQYQGVLNRFASGQTKILVGTQMVAKGFDFENIGLVGILNADNMMNFPDFRASERAFQLMVQVSGRAGRRNQQGLVVLQTSQPEHYLIPAVLSQNMSVFYQNELQERKEFGYPPFVRLIEIQVRHKQYTEACQIADELALHLQKHREVRVLGPSAGVIGRVQQYFVRQMLLKVIGSGAQVRQQIMEHINQIKKIHPTAVVVVDVDPI